MADSATVQKVLGAAQDEIRLSVSGYGGVSFQISGTFDATISFEASVHGQEFVAFRVVGSNSSSQVTTATTAGVYTGSTVGFSVVRARISAYTSGGASVVILAAVASPTVPPAAGASGGTASDFGATFPTAGTAAGFIDQSGNMAGATLAADGSLEVTLVGGGGSGGTSSTFGAAFPADGTAIGIADPDGNMHALSGETLDYDTGAGTAAQTVIGIALPASGGPVAGGTSTNPLQVGDAGGSLTVDGTVTASNVTGNVAADSADSGNPVKVGAVAFSPDGTTPSTAVAEGDRSNVKTDLDGSLFVKVYPATSKTVHLDGSSAYTDQALVPDPGDGFQQVITNIIASTGAATALNFFLEEGSTKIFGPVYLEAVAGRGFCSGPIYLPCTASTAVTLTSSANIAQSFQVSYFTQAI